MDRQPLIDEMIAFIEKQRPGEIEKIRSSNPGFKNILKSGTELGQNEEKNLEELKVRAKVCFAALDIAISSCTAALPKLKGRLKSSQKLQLSGQIIATVCSASVITTLATDHKTITYIGGILALIGSLLPLLVDYLKKGTDASKQLGDAYPELVKNKLEAEHNSKELDFFINKNFSVDGISDVINRSNKLCADISITLASL